MADTRPMIDAFALGEFETNCFVVTVPGGSDPSGCCIVDCGFDPEPMFASIDERGLEPRAIWLTHAHADHIAGVDAALARYGPLPLAIHEAEREFCTDPRLNLSAYLGQPVTCRAPTRLLRDGDVAEMAGATFRVVHAPGHSPGGVLYVHDASMQAIVGDTLFAGSMGRVDFPTSNPEVMSRTLRDVLMRLPDEMTIWPGHGPSTTIGRERRSNPFVGSAPFFPGRA